ncbi:DUF6708 domain-containing protein [Chromobacterium sp. Beijing]|uniref:DUF6708 domain-containing protein n=1 Tax=Chromobacterium sp. Beijing TaxID=2735795 RepID=UPI001F230CFC|nr:DUF6708 domain-containing protein [Chromobacterium sp. Beijing]UJB30813.1 hypothetical protein HQN78_06940 [Chromobacterium sp. Beijing]
MEYTGKVPKYKVNRPITNQELELKLEQKINSGAQPNYQLSVISINSKSMQLVDKFFLWKGLLTFVAIAGLALITWMLIGNILISYDKPSGLAGDWGFLLAILLMAIPVALLNLWILHKDLGFTHYPILLDRLNGKVHFFRQDGSVSSSKWSDIFFCFARVKNQTWEIQGHILDENQEIVIDTFSFSEVGVGEQDRQQLLSYWEFVRTYMENGPSEVASEIEACLPISQKKETFIFAMLRMRYILSSIPFPLQLILLAFYLLIYPARWIAMHASKIPKWPAELEALSHAAPGDPYHRDASTNT